MSTVAELLTADKLPLLIGLLGQNAVKHRSTEFERLGLAPLWQAERDLAFLARHVLRQACFHAQQAAEKALKGFLTARAGTHPKGHNLEQLLLGT